MSQTKNEEEMQKLLDLENEHAGSKNSSSQLFSTSNEDEQHYMNALNEHSASCQEEKTAGELGGSKAHMGTQGSEQCSHSMPPPLESSISHNVGSLAGSDDIEAFIMQPELQQLLQLETSLFKLLQESSISDFMIPTQSQPLDSFADADQEQEPAQPQIGGSLKNLENYLIRGDLRRCVLCNSKYQEPDPEKGTAGNLPRVLYCGDCICEQCITKQIQRASIADRKSVRNVAACQVVCPICTDKHIFKLTKTGYIICNDKYIKMTDEKGPVNFFPPSKLGPSSRALGKDSNLQLMDHSISIPSSLVLRSLPVNVELVELLRTRRRGKSPSQIEKISSSNSPGPTPAPASTPLLNTDVPKKESKTMTVARKKKQKAPSFDEKVFTAEQDPEPQVKIQKSEIVPPPSLSELQKQSQLQREAIQRKAREESKHMKGPLPGASAADPSSMPPLTSRLAGSELGQPPFPGHLETLGMSDQFAEQFFGRLELRKDGPNQLEEKARRRKEQLRKKTLFGISHSSKPNSFKNAAHNIKEKAALN